MVACFEYLVAILDMTYCVNLKHAHILAMHDYLNKDKVIMKTTTTKTMLITIMLTQWKTYSIKLHKNIKFTFKIIQTQFKYRPKNESLGASVWSDFSEYDF